MYAYTYHRRYTCKHAYMHINMCPSTGFIYVQMHTHVHLWLCLEIWICACACKSACTSTWIYIYVCVHVYLRIRVYNVLRKMAHDASKCIFVRAMCDEQCMKIYDVCCTMDSVHWWMNDDVCCMVADKGCVLWDLCCAIKHVTSHITHHTTHITPHIPSITPTIVHGQSSSSISPSYANTHPQTTYIIRAQLYIVHHRTSDHRAPRIAHHQTTTPDVFLCGSWMLHECLRARVNW